MSIASELKARFPEVVAVQVNDAAFHGEPATYVSVLLTNDKIIHGIYTKTEKESFGGVKFAGRKDVVALMSHKIDSVLRGTHEEG